MGYTPFAIMFASSVILSLIALGALIYAGTF